MEKDIVTKLSRELHIGISTEAQTVYLLVEIRKLMEHNTTKRFDTLKMFCDWGLHIELSRNRQIQKFLDEFDAAVGRTDSGYGPKDIGYLSLGKFKEALREFVKDFGLPQNILEDAQWSKFVRLYSEVVSDCPVTQKDHSFKFIREIKINVGYPDSTSAGYKKYREGFYLEWLVTRKDGKKIHWELLGEPS
jgi:hypothetical protein